MLPAREKLEKRPPLTGALLVGENNMIARENTLFA